MRLLDDLHKPAGTATHYRQLVAALPYFAGLDGCVIDEILGMLSIRDAPAGTAIYLEGDGADDAPLHMVLDGTVRIYKASLRGREQTLCIFQRGETFSDVPLFDGGPYPVSADALVDATIGLLPRAAFIELMSAHPSIALAATRLLSERLRQFGGLIEDLSLRPVLSRVARLLVSDDRGRLNQSQMAAMIGTSREVVNRSLRNLEADGVIELQRGQIAVRDLSRLLDMIDGV